MSDTRGLDTPSASAPGYSTSEPGADRWDRSGYELTHEPDGRSWTARENLTDILQRELLGPASGDDEVITVPPDSRYLIGRIAPVKLKESKEPPTSEADDDADEESPVAEFGDEHDALESTGVPAVTGDDSGPDSDEDVAGDRDDEPVKRGLMIPASMGLRFQVPGDLKQVTVTTSWGTYNPERTGEVLPSGREVRAFRRTPHDHRTPIRLGELSAGETKDYVLEDDVVLRVDVATDPNDTDRLLMEVALCNDQVTPRKIPVNAWLFQTQIYVEAEGAEAFLPVRDALIDERFEPDAELRRLALQYRDRLEFAIGRTCSADWTMAPQARRATQVRTTWLPIAETPQINPVETPGTVLDMTALARSSADEVERGLRPIVDAYEDWLKNQETEAKSLPQHLREDAAELIVEARLVHAQLSDGLDCLTSNAEALQCFQFMNRVMADQRIHTQIADLRSEDQSLSIDNARAQVLASDHPHHWRTFQIAFVLMQIRSLAEPETARRSGDAANVELLFFPTGGGKTEAYLGLAAFTFAIRRQQGVVVSDDGDLDGRSGIAVLMRYTLRLLTSQQFERAAALICAAEVARLEAPEVWGDEPFRIGLWVGTGVSPKRVAEADSELRNFLVKKGSGHRLTMLQVTRCPWCGTEILPGEAIKVDTTEGRVRIWCSDDEFDCPFAEGGDAFDGLPMLTVDEEIYRLAPTFVIATVDKFARLAREGEAAALFGYVGERCDRHGYVHPDYQKCDLKDGSKHPKKDGFPAAAKRPVARLRPPDLIIQDELHLITGALGTTVGLFETAIDLLCTWARSDGSVIKPLVVASSATVRNAGEQVRGLYGRGVTMFPPQVLDVADTFFSKEVPVSPEKPGRRYVGISTTGVRLTAAEIQIAQVLMAGAQELLDRSGDAADPYLTLVGYFNATRELAGMARYLQDDVQNALRKGIPGTNLPRRYGTDFNGLNTDELTSRVSSSEITQNLARMKVPFDPAFDSAQGRDGRKAARSRGEKPANRAVQPYDAILATSMLQVGVDVTRLGLMLMVGQPKSTAEYIQASSRVGRDANRPGLVITLGNWARPRDLAHYEQFRHYHQTFYAQVEPLSVTPFSVTSMERGLDGVLVSVARVLRARSGKGGLSTEKGAGRVSDERALIEDLIDRLVARIRDASDEPSTEHARQRLISRLGQWEKRRTSLLGRANLSYEKPYDTKDGAFQPLIRSAETVRSRDAGLHDAPFIVANSMREVQPEINLLVSPIKERLLYVEPPSAPTWSERQGQDS